MLSPVRSWATRRGLSAWSAAALVTALAGVGVVALVSPILFVLHERRQTALDFVRSLPDVIPVTVGDTTFAIEAAPVTGRVTGPVSDTAVTAAGAAAILVSEAVVFALLYRPEDLHTAAASVAPSAYHDLVAAYHRRTRQTLQTIYLLQAATVAGTFLLALVVSAGLGYQSPAFLAVVAGVS